MEQPPCRKQQVLGDNGGFLDGAERSRNYTSAWPLLRSLLEYMLHVHVAKWTDQAKPWFTSIVSLCPEGATDLRGSCP